MGSTSPLDIVFKKDNDSSGNASNDNEYACRDVYLCIRANLITSFGYVGCPSMTIYLVRTIHSSTFPQLHYAYVKLNFQAYLHNLQNHSGRGIGFPL